MNTAIHHHHYTGSHHWMTLAVAAGAAIAIGAGSYAVLHASSSDDPFDRNQTIVVPDYMASAFEAKAAATVQPTIVVPDYMASAFEAKAAATVQPTIVVPDYMASAFEAKAAATEQPAAVSSPPVHVPPVATGYDLALGGPEGTGLVPRTEMTTPR